jgi:guanylate kinase
MKKLFLVDGAAGTGKSDLVEYVRTTRNCGVLIKATTRQLRNYERVERVPLDLAFYSREAFIARHLDYTYEYRDEYYGFNRSDLVDLLSKFQNVFAIIRSIPVMRQLQVDFSDYRVVTVYVRADATSVEERLRQQCRSEADIQMRLSRVAESIADFKRHRSFFNEILYNMGEKNTYYSAVDSLLARYETGDANE